jgi:hypothetical protein
LHPAHSFGLDYFGPTGRSAPPNMQRLLASKKNVLGFAGWLANLFPGFRVAFVGRKPFRLSCWIR